MNTEVTRFMRRVEKSDGCWTWLGYVNRGGYGRAAAYGRQWMAHRLAYILLVGPIPDGLTIDHLCFNTRCVNPAHLEPVTLSVNAARSRLATARRERTQCPAGHPYDDANTVVISDGRKCRECERVWRRVEYSRSKDKTLAHQRDYYRENRAKILARQATYKARRKALALLTAPDTTKGTDP